MKNINIPIADERHIDLGFIQEYYSAKMGVKLSKAQTIQTLLYETANLIRNTGESYPNRDWSLVNQEREMHNSYENAERSE